MKSKTFLPTLAKLLCLALISLNAFSANAQCSPDTQTPTAVCEAFVNISLPASGVVTLLPEFFDAGSNDNCTPAEDLIFTVSPNSASCADIGTLLLVEMTVMDQSGNVNSCVANVMIEDKLPPVLTCSSALNISLPASGEFTLTPETLLLVPDPDNCDLTYTITPEKVDCSDIGAPIPFTISGTDPSGNTASCGGLLNVEDKLSFTLFCSANINVNLPATGNLILTPEMFVLADTENCSLTYSISPAQLDCSDAGSTVSVLVSAVDAGGFNNSCSSNVTVMAPSPTAVSILPPPSIACGETGLVFNSTVSGGAGSYIYDWTIKKGASTGWTISTGQGTPSITMTAGTGKLKLDLEVTGVCGGKKKDKYNVTPNCSAAPQIISNNDLEPLAEKIFSKASVESFFIYPNPASTQLNLELANGQESEAAVFSLYNHLGQPMMPTTKLAAGNRFLTLTVEYLPDGIYFVVLQKQDGSQLSQKFLKH